MVRDRLGSNAPLDSLDLIFKPEYAEKLKDCGIALIDAPSTVFPMIFAYLGIDPHTAASNGYAAAVKLMQAVRPNIRYFHSSSYINDLAKGSICAVLGWSGDVSIASWRATDAGNRNHIEYHIPKEGALIWMDVLAIPKDAQNADSALTFIDYLLDPEVATEGVNYVQFASAVKPTLLPMINLQVSQNAGIYPVEEVRRKLFADKMQDYSVQMLQINTWKRIKSGS